MPRVLSAKGKQKRKRMGRPPKAKHVPLDAIPWGSDKAAANALAPRPVRKTPVQLALEALESVDRSILLQTVIRGLAQGQTLAQRALLADRAMQTFSFIMRESRL